jgi:polar amino acid transport system substrate-binding protein
MCPQSGQIHRLRPPASPDQSNTQRIHTDESFATSLPNVISLGWRGMIPTLRLTCTTACLLVGFVTAAPAAPLTPYTAPSQADSQPIDKPDAIPNRKLVVSTKPLDPFVAKNEDGTYSGFSVDLWTEVARRNNWAFEWKYNETVTQVVDDVAQRRADIGIAGITINQERESVVDFSHPMFNAGLQIAVGGSNKSDLRAWLGQVFSPSLFRLIAILAGFIFIAGNILWLTRFRRRSETHSYGKGLLAGVWFAGKTLGSADFGDEEPTKPLSRLAALGWMFLGIIIIQYFTAMTTSQLTVKKIEGSIQSVNDLPGKQIVTVEGTTADKWLTEQGYPHRRVQTIEDAYPLLLDGESEAIVFDAPVLLRWVATAGQGRARLVGAVFKPEAYGIATQQGSTARETINRTLLEMQNDGTYDNMYTKWFG